MAEKKYISLDAALESICENCSESSICNGVCDETDRIRAIPVADVVERKSGKWKLRHDGSAKCSECGFVQICAWDMDSWDNYCHHCGADMREV